MEKLHDYQGWGGRFHEFRDNTKARFENWREEHPESMLELFKNTIHKHTSQNADSNALDVDYSHVYRKKSRLELIRISAAVMGIEFSYAAETAFVSPTLLKIGVLHQHMTLVWALSPLVGFFLTPILGSFSDRCRLTLGRRRPFIILLSIGVVIGLILVPNGEDLGYAMGDMDYGRVYDSQNGTLQSQNPYRATASETEENLQSNSHPWGIFFTILGTVLLDFDADASQSPSRAYLLDSLVTEDHAKGLSTFTIMAGLGGFFGYSLGGVNWDETSIGIALGGHVRAVFTLITIIFIICVSFTLSSFPEIPLYILEKDMKSNIPHDFDVEETLEVATNGNDNNTNTNEQLKVISKIESSSYGSIAADIPPDEKIEMPKFNPKRRYTMPPLPSDSKDYSTVPGENIAETSFTDHAPNLPQPPPEEPTASLMHYLVSIIFMPHSLRMVCLTNLFCWMAHVCYSLYFTDFVGEAVFGGDPKAFEGDIKHTLYEDGIRFGCWGMAMYSLSCACYSTIIEKLIKKYKAKRVYIGGLLFYCSGMSLMALTKHKIGVILFSWTAGVMYSTLFTMPYLLVANYHAQGVFELTAEGTPKLGMELRGLGTDIAIVSSMVFLAQFILSLCMGTIVSVTKTTTAVVSVASFLSFCGAISATQIMYLDL